MLPNIEKLRTTIENQGFTLDTSNLESLGFIPNNTKKDTNI